MHNESKLEKIHRSNVKIVVACVVMFVFIAFAKWGVTFVTVKALIGIFSGATVGILFALFGKTDLVRSVGLMASMGIGSFFYSGAVGGSAAGGLISFALIAMTARYYTKRIMFWFAIPTGISMFIASIVAPYSVLGPRGTRLEAIFQTALFAIMAYMVEKSIRLGDGVNKDTMKVLEQIEKDAIEQGKMAQKAYRRQTSALFGACRADTAFHGGFVGVSDSFAWLFLRTGALFGDQGACKQPLDCGRAGVVCLAGADKCRGAQYLYLCFSYRARPRGSRQTNSGSGGGC
jgi:hypothetical protein